MLRREFLKQTALGIAVWSAPRVLLAAPIGQRPNILILTTDQQQVGVMSAVGNKWVKTPHMDSLAVGGVYFRKSYCPYPLCSPSRASLHTSRMPHEMGVDRNDVAIDAGIPVMGKIFRDAGYDTGYSGKWHLPQTYPSATEGITGFEVLNKTTRQGKLAKDIDSSTAEQAAEFLMRKRDKPFLLVVSFINPHDICLLAGGGGQKLAAEVQKTYAPPPDAELPPLPANHAFIAKEPGPIARRRTVANAGKNQFNGGWDEMRWRRYLYAYYRMLEDVDQAVGRVLEALRASGQSDNTLIVFTSDHGEGMGAHDWTGKMMFYEEEAAVPLILNWKGQIPAGRIDMDHLVSSLDVFPTLCDYASVTPPAVVRGESLRPVIVRPALPGHAFVASEMVTNGGPGAGPIRSFMVRTQRFKYIDFPSSTDPEMLFDLVADPGELKNLATDPAQAGELERHRKMLKEWNDQTELEQHPIAAAPGKAKRGRQK